MSEQTLPGYLKKILEHHVSQSDITRDAELEGIFEKLNSLTESVERLKAQARKNKSKRDI